MGRILRPVFYPPSMQVLLLYGFLAIKGGYRKEFSPYTMTVHSDGTVVLGNGEREIKMPRPMPLENILGMAAAMNMLYPTT